MKFPDSFLEEIRTRLPVSSVVARRVQLKRRGREFVGLSPFKQEKTPSFTVNDVKGFYHCFASGEHGDIFKFLQRTEGLSFPEAVERLAGEAGLDVPKPDPTFERFERKRKSLFEVMDAACEHFQKALRSQEGKVALDYALRRGLRDETIQEFRIGYASRASTLLKKALQKKGITEEQMLECGLIIKPDDGRDSFDRFRDRLMIPIQDSRGNVIAFGGRAIAEDVQPKYLNSPETSLFHKGSVVFNFHRARTPAFETNEAVVVEGYLDAIAVYQAGMKNVVATLGTAFTERQFDLLWRLSPEPIICFDGDKAGTAAAHRSIDRILPQLKMGRSFRFAFLPDGLDPDDLVRSGDVSQFKQLLESSSPLSEVFWRRETLMAKLDTPERKAALEAKIKRLVDTIGEPEVHRQYARTFRIRLGKLFWEADRDLEPELHSELLQTLGIRGTAIERILLGMLVHFPGIFDKHIDEITKLRMSCEEFDKFKEELVRIITLPEEISVITFYDQIDYRFYTLLDDVHGDEDRKKSLQYGHRLFQRFPLIKMHPEMDFVDGCVSLFIMMLQLRNIRRDIDEAMADYQGDISAVNEDRLLQLVREASDHETRIRVAEQELLDWAITIRSMFVEQPRRTMTRTVERAVREVA